MLTSPLLPVPHGFTTREGGVSEGPYRSLNLAISTGDDPARVGENQRRVLEKFGNPPVALLNQQHGNVVRIVNEAGVWDGDGLLSSTPGLLLRVGIADCYPILLHDPVKNVVGALHAGWRGTVSGILPRGLELLGESFGCEPGDVRVAVGAGIGGPRFQVGAEVIEQFKGSGENASSLYWPDPEQEGKYRLDLEAAIRQQALEHRIRPENYWALGACTYDDPRFFSHRRDKGVTGRMWALIGLPNDER